MFHSHTRVCYPPKTLPKHCFNAISTSFIETGKPRSIRLDWDELTRRGLLHQLPNDDGPPELSLALPPGKIRIADLIDSTGATGESADGNLPGHTLLQQLAAAQNQALADATLASNTTARRGDG